MSFVSHAFSSFRVVEFTEDLGSPCSAKPTYTAKSSITQYHARRFGCKLLLNTDGTKKQVSCHACPSLSYSGFENFVDSSGTNWKNHQSWVQSVREIATQTCPSNTFDLQERAFTPIGENERYSERPPTPRGLSYAQLVDERKPVSPAPLRAPRNSSKK